MLKKIVLGVLFLGLIGVLVAGAVIRTLDRTEIVAEARGRGLGRNQDYGDIGDCTEDGVRQGYDRGNVETTADAAGGSGRGLGRAGEGLADRQYPNLRDNPDVWLDSFSRPAWAGAGRNAQPDDAGVGQAEVEEWLAIQGTVVSVDTNTLVVQTDNDEQLAVENRAWRFAQEQGFATQVGNQVTLVGFYEDDDPLTGSGQRFEVGRIEDNTNSQTVLVREENGRPLWAGRGRGGGL